MFSYRMSRSIMCLNLFNDIGYIFCSSRCRYNRSITIGPVLYVVNNYSKNFQCHVMKPSNSYFQLFASCNQSIPNIKQYSKNVKTPPPPVSGKLGQEGNLKKKSLQGGVTISDVIVGSGTAVKSGKTVTVYYSGRLKSTNELFDAMTSGSGLTFRLGKGEVIDGWDVGLVGMKVGGRRIITCPPSMAYGVKGSPPKIPPNSTLVFEVQLKAVK